MKTFKSILEFQKAFSTDEACRAELELIRWNGTPACPFCGSLNVHRHPNAKKFNCKEKPCRKIFSVTVGTIYENTKIPLSKWFLAQYILTVHSKGISSLQLAGWLDVTQKTAWFLNHRIREMLADSEPALLGGVVEVDETYIGGKEGNKPKSKRKVKAGATGKAMVFGAVERTGEVKTRVVPNATKENLLQGVKDFVAKGSVMVTDELPAYKDLAKSYSHHVVKHKSEEYVRGAAHTGTIDGYWNILKKQINGIHHSVSPKHLQRYCDESAYRYNRRTLTQDERFNASIVKAEGKRLKYEDLILNIAEQ